MIKARIKIGNGAVEDTFAAHRLIYISADNRTEAPVKKMDESSYIGEAGAHTDPRTVQDVFDYKVVFAIDTTDTDLSSANAIVAAFNAKLYTQTAGSNVRAYKVVTFYNDFKRVKIVGIPRPIVEPVETRRTRGGLDYAKIEFVIRVDNPGLCNFNMTDPLG